MQVNPIIVVMAVCVLAEVVLTLFHQVVPSIIDHVLLVLLAVLVPEESLRASSSRTVVKSETVTPAESGAGPDVEG